MVGVHLQSREQEGKPRETGIVLLLCHHEAVVWGGGGGHWVKGSTIIMHETYCHCRFCKVKTVQLQLRLHLQEMVQQRSTSTAQVQH